MGEDTSSRPNKKAYTKVLQEDLPTEGSLLHKWEQINQKRCGVSKAASWIVLAAAAVLLLILLILLGRGMFSSPSPAPQAVQEQASRVNLDPMSNADPFSGNGFSRTSTVISTHIGPDGKMVTETTTEKFGTDENGQTTATRETKKGQGADSGAEKMMADMKNMLGGFGGFFNEPDPFQQMFNQPQGLFGQRQDPLDGLLDNLLGGNGGFGGFGAPMQMHMNFGQPAHNVLRLRDMFQPRQPNPMETIFNGILGGLVDDLQGGPEIQFIGQPEVQVITMNLDDAGKSATPEIQVTKPVES